MEAWRRLRRLAGERRWRRRRERQWRRLRWKERQWRRRRERQSASTLVSDKAANKAAAARWQGG
ncbi:hypothetical protein LINPERHAP2_LOCUS34515, partial [Linum perenne]